MTWNLASVWPGGHDTSWVHWAVDKVGVTWAYIPYEWRELLKQPGVLEASLMAIALSCTLIGFAFSTAFIGTGAGIGAGNKISFAQMVFGIWARLGRFRNLMCAPCDRARRRYPIANTCQIPFFKDISDVYNFVFGYKTEGLFVEIGAYDGESFSNTSCLADVGWTGHYVEPIPAYAEICARRHAPNRRVTVHTLCVGEMDGQEVELSTAGPFSSAVEDEIASVTSSRLHTALQAMGWSHNRSNTSDEGVGTSPSVTGVADVATAEVANGAGAADAADGGAAADGPAAVRTPGGGRTRGHSSAASATGGAIASSATPRQIVGAEADDACAAASGVAPATTVGNPAAPSSTAVPDCIAVQRVKTTTVSLNTFLQKARIPDDGAIDVMVIDTEGFEWPILKSFDVNTYRPKMVIVEVQELQARYRSNPRAQADAVSIFSFFTNAGYGILYKDVVNTIFIDRNVPVVGGD